MGLTWIGTRTKERGVFNPDGIDRAPTPVVSDSDLLTKGSLFLEVTVRPRTKPVNLIRWSTRDPWPAGMTLCLEPDVTLRLMMRQGARHLSTSLKTTLARKMLTAHITFNWDAPPRNSRYRGGRHR